MIKKNKLKKSHEHNELKYLKKHYDFKHLNLQSYGVNEKFARSIIFSLDSTDLGEIVSEKTNGPDMRAVIGADVYGVEHFQYDASEKGRKGSAEKVEINNKMNMLSKECSEILSPGQSYFSTYRLRTKTSIGALKKNFLENLYKHSERINNYKENIGSDNVIFIVEDTSISPITIHSPGMQRRILIPALYNDIEEELLRISISGIIFLSSYPISNTVVFVKNTKEAYLALRESYQFFDSSTRIEIDNNVRIGYGFIGI